MGFEKGAAVAAIASSLFDKVTRCWGEIEIGGTSSPCLPRNHISHCCGSYQAYWA